jgi:hypothetical protein
VEIRDAATGKELVAVRGRDEMLAPVSMTAAFSPSGRRLMMATVCQWNRKVDGEPEFRSEVKVWDVTSGEELFTLPGEEGLHIVSFDSGGRLLAWVTRDGKMTVWDGSPPEDPGE